MDIDAAHYKLAAVQVSREYGDPLIMTQACLDPVTVFMLLQLALCGGDCIW